MTFTYLSQFNWRMFIAVKINSDQKERIYKATKEKAFKTMFSNSPEAVHPEVFLGKRVLKICSKFTGEHPCWSAISIKLLYNLLALQLCNFIEIVLRHGCCPVNLLNIFRTPFPKKISGRLHPIALLCAKLLLKFLRLKNYFNFIFGTCKKSILKTNNFAPIIATTQSKKIFLKIVRNIAWSTACTS